MPIFNLNPTGVQSYMKQNQLTLEQKEVAEAYARSIVTLVQNLKAPTWDYLVSLVAGGMTLEAASKKIFEHTRDRLVHLSNGMWNTLQAANITRLVFHELKKQYDSEGYSSEELQIIVDRIITGK